MGVSPLKVRVETGIQVAAVTSESYCDFNLTTPDLVSGDLCTAALSWAECFLLRYGVCLVSCRGLHDA